jgi:iron complex transport system substrate-binding protein
MAVVMRAAFALFLAVLPLATANAAIEVVDDSGATVSIAAPARRIVSLAPHATELVFAAGAGDRLIGVVAGSDWPPAARALPRIGDVHAIDLERILALKPDLAITWPYTTPAQVDQLRARGIAVIVTDPKTIDGIATAVERIGALAGTKESARNAAASFRAHLSRLRNARSRAARIRVFYEIWDSPLFTVGGRHVITQALDVCAADNVFTELATPAPAVTVEAVLAAAPDAIVAAMENGAQPAWLDAWKRWPELPATRYGNFATVDADLLHRPGPRFVDGVEALCAAIDAARARMITVRRTPELSRSPR